MENNHVLIIEDDKNIAEYFKAVLAMAGMEVDVVLSAREGLVSLAGSTPGLILLDMNLGNDIGGEDILYQIRSNPRLDGSRVIVITGYPNTVQMVTDLADLVLIKPVGIDQLTTLAQRMISYKVAPRVLSFRDPVTSVFNLEFFHTRLELAFERAKRRPDFVYAVMDIQVEPGNQAAENARHNVDFQIAMLTEAARRLKQNIRPTDTIARADGWRFVTLHEDLRQKEDTAILVGRMQTILAAPVEWRGDSYTMKMVCGTAVMQPGRQGPMDILNAASQNLEQALASRNAV